MWRQRSSSADHGPSQGEVHAQPTAAVTKVGLTTLEEAHPCAGASEHIGGRQPRQ